MKFIVVLLAFASLTSCSSKVEHVEKAFYFWRSNSYRMSYKEDSILKNQNIKKLYIKYFEVEHHPVMGNIPFAKTELNFGFNSIDSLIMIPTVYIKNEVFKNSTNAELDVLADNINFLIKKYSSGYKNNITEYQMDCDWTKSTQDKYFYFLKSLKKISQKEVSCTLRLYPYKYPDIMGVPPVDRATLMCYNLLQPLQNKKLNTILDENELRSYLSSKHSYPVHLDVALPVFSMMQLYQNGKFAGIIYDTEALVPVLKQQNDLWFEVTQDIVVGRQFIRRGDRIKYEKIDARVIDNAIRLLKEEVELDATVTVTLFHLDHAQLKNYTNEEINRFYTGFIN